ncbi:hypothetical protein ACF0H5_005460 [Mactra antiquata]
MSKYKVSKKQKELKHLQNLVHSERETLHKLQSQKGHISVRNVTKRDEAAATNRKVLCETRKSKSKLKMKVRPLQILFAEALQQGAKHVVTGGGPQSGHCRAVSLICRSLGLKPHIVIEGVYKDTLKTTSAEMLRTVQKQMQDFLTGQFSEPPTTNNLRTEFANKTNQSCKHHFGDLDSS